MIATVDFDLSDGPHTATLGDDGRWSCRSAPAAETMLNVLFNLRGYGPADGSAGHIQAHAAAECLGGTATFEPKTPHPEGTVF